MQLDKLRPERPTQRYARRVVNRFVVSAFQASIHTNIRFRWLTPPAVDVSALRALYNYTIGLEAKPAPRKSPDIAHRTSTGSLKKARCSRIPIHNRAAQPAGLRSSSGSTRSAPVY